MLEEVYKWIQNIAVYLVVVTAMLHAVPGTYSPRHADPRLLAIPTSRRRVAACDPNWDCF